MSYQSREPFKIDEPGGGKKLIIADDSAQPTDFWGLCEGAKAMNVGYLGFCYQPGTFPWRDILSEYQKDPKNSELFLDYDGTISKLDGYNTVNSEEYKEFFTSFKGPSFQKWALRGANDQGKIDESNEDEVIKKFKSILQEKPELKFRIAPDFIESICLSENPPQKIHIITRNGAAFVKYMLTAEIELALETKSIENPRVEAKKIVSRFEIHEAYGNKREIVTKILQNLNCMDIKFLPWFYQDIIERKNGTFKRNCLKKIQETCANLDPKTDSETRDRILILLLAVCKIHENPILDWVRGIKETKSEKEFKHLIGDEKFNQLSQSIPSTCDEKWFDNELATINPEQISKKL